jgi:hypothetical protein
VWDWQANDRISSPLLRTAAEALNWQRAAHALAEGGRGVEAGEMTASHHEAEADPTEQLFWWAFCYVGLCFVGVAVALVASDIAG